MQLPYCSHNHLLFFPSYFLSHSIHSIFHIWNQQSFFLSCKSPFLFIFIIFQDFHVSYIHVQILWWSGVLCVQIFITFFYRKPFISYSLVYLWPNCLLLPFLLHVKKILLLPHKTAKYTFYSCTCYFTNKCSHTKKNRIIFFLWCATIPYIA